MNRQEFKKYLEAHPFNDAMLELRRQAGERANRYGYRYMTFAELQEELCGYVKSGNMPMSAAMSDAMRPFKNVDNGKEMFRVEGPDGPNGWKIERVHRDKIDWWLFDSEPLPDQLDPEIAKKADKLWKQFNDGIRNLGLTLVIDLNTDYDPLHLGVVGGKVKTRPEHSCEDSTHYFDTPTCEYISVDTKYGTIVKDFDACQEY